MMRHRCSSEPSLSSSFSSGSPSVLTSSQCKNTRRRHFGIDVLIWSRIESCVLSQDFSRCPAPDHPTRYDCSCALLYDYLRIDCRLPVVSGPLTAPPPGTNVLTHPHFSVPIHAFWDLEDRVHARCVNINLLFLVAGGVNCAMDALIIFMV